MIRAFRKIGGALKSVGRFIIRRDVLRALSDVAVFVPVIGAPLAIALDFVEEAEAKYPEPGSGTDKMAWAIEHAIIALNTVGYEEKRVKGLLELALLIFKDEAQIRSDEE